MFPSLVVVELLLLWLDIDLQTLC